MDTHKPQHLDLQPDGDDWLTVEPYAGYATGCVLRLQLRKPGPNKKPVVVTLRLNKDATAKLAGVAEDLTNLETTARKRQLEEMKEELKDQEKFLADLRKKIARKESELAGVPAEYHGLDASDTFSKAMEKPEEDDEDCEGQ